MADLTVPSVEPAKEVSSAGMVSDRPRINARPLGGGPVRQESLRESNLTLVVAQIFGSDVPLSRSQVVAATGLTRATVSRIVDQLLAAAIVEEQDPILGGGAGRPIVPLVPARGSLVAIGLEVNTASIGGCAVDLAGRVLSERVEHGDFIDSDPREVLSALGKIADELIKQVEGAGGTFIGSHLALPGVIDPSSRRLLLAPRLGWREIDPVRLLGRRRRLIARPVQVGSVLSHAALAEASLRHQDGEGQDFLYVAGDNAVGSALVINGEVLTSKLGWDGNIGHVMVDPAGGICRCGARGCLDLYIGRRTILEAAGLPVTMSIEELVALGQDGSSKRLNDTLLGAGTALGIGLATMVNMVGVRTVILGDNLAELLPILRPIIEDQLRTRLLTSDFAMPVVEAAISKRHAAMVGGALSVLQTVLSDLQNWLASESAD